MAEHFAVINAYDRPAVCFDFDGYLAPQGTDGPPDPNLRKLADWLKRLGWWVIVASARPAAHYPAVERWVQLHGMQQLVDQIALGSKPAADAFLDDRQPQLPMPALIEWLQRIEDTRLGLDPLAEQAAGHGSGPWRAELWPSAGERFDRHFVVTIAFSGGLDSATAWLLAAKAGLPFELVYVDTGVPYSAHEVAAATLLISKVGEVFEQPTPPLFYRYQPIGYAPAPKHAPYLQLGRNTVIVEHLAAMLTRQGRWGEVWLAANDGPGEMPIVGGDKTHRWWASQQHLLTAAGHDVRLHQPLAGWTKADMLRWWAANLPDGASLAAWTRSCHADVAGHCGHCWACMRRWLAFASTGYPHVLHWPHGHDFTSLLAKARADHARARADAQQAGTRSVAFAPGRLDEWAAADTYQPQEA